MNPDKPAHRSKRTPYEQVRGFALYEAWRKVRENGLRSLSLETQNAIREFEGSLPTHLRRINRHLRDGTFQFIPQTGVLKKRPGKKPRPLVVGAIQNRIVQRAILDVLQEIPAVDMILKTPSSFGGIRERDRKAAIAAARVSIRAGSRYFIRSDIRDFFTKIPRHVILDFLGRHIKDAKFLDLVKCAMETMLANLAQLGEDAALFPLGSEGVAQGSPLSPLMGNILLSNFDKQMNGRGITCLRYIDDFLLLGPDAAKVRKAFENAQKKLAAFGMEPYDPRIAPDKAEMGETAKRFDFLGCTMLPGFVQPSRKARRKLMEVVKEKLKAGRTEMIVASKRASHQMPRKRFVQTLTDLDNFLLGWGHAYAFCNDQELFKQLDETISKAVREFMQWSDRFLSGPDPAFRRALGVHLLSDTLLTPLTPNG